MRRGDVGRRWRVEPREGTAAFREGARRWRLQEDWCGDWCAETSPGLCVAALAPATGATPINGEMLKDPDERRGVARKTSCSRIVPAEKVPPAIAWLVAPEAAHVVGSRLFLDGGMLLHPNFV